MSQAAYAPLSSEAAPDASGPVPNGTPDRHALRGLGYEEGVRALTPPPQNAFPANPMAPTSGFEMTDSAEEFVEDPSAYCDDVQVDDRRALTRFASELDLVVAGTDWATQRLEDEPDTSGWRHVRSWIAGFFNTEVPSTLRDQSFPVPGMERAEAVQARSPIFQSRLDLVAEVGAMLAPTTVDWMADYVAFDRGLPGRQQVVELLGTIGVPTAGLAQHEYTLEVDLGADVGADVIGNGGGVSVVRYTLSYSGPRGEWSVQQNCAGVEVQVGLAAGPELPISANVHLPSVTGTTHNPTYISERQFRGVTALSELSVGVSVAGGVVSVSEGFITFANGLQFTVGGPSAGVPARFGTSSTTDVGGGGNAEAAFCLSSGFERTQDVGDLQHVEMPEAEPDLRRIMFSQTRVQFPTGGAELQDADFDAIRETAETLLSTDMAALENDYGLRFEIVVAGGASSEWDGAATIEEANWNNLLLSQERARAVSEEFEWALWDASYGDEDRPDVSHDGTDAVAFGSTLAQREEGQGYSDERYREAVIFVWADFDCGARGQGDVR